MILEDIRLALAMRWRPHEYLDAAEAAYRERTGQAPPAGWRERLAERLRALQLPEDPLAYFDAGFLGQLRAQRLLPQRQSRRVVEAYDAPRLAAAIERGDWQGALRAMGLPISGTLIDEWRGELGGTDLRVVVSAIDYARRQRIRVRMPSDWRRAAQAFHGLPAAERRAWWCDLAAELGIHHGLPERSPSTHEEDA